MMYKMIACQKEDLQICSVDSFYKKGKSLWVRLLSQRGEGTAKSDRCLSLKAQAEP